MASATIQPKIPGSANAVSGTPAVVTSDDALMSLIGALLEGGGDSGKAATAWYQDRLAKSKSATKAA